MHSHRSLDIIERHRVHLKDFSFSDGYAGAFHADMVELADTPDLGSGAFRRTGSSPAIRTSPSVHMDTRTFYLAKCRYEHPHQSRASTRKSRSGFLLYYGFALAFMTGIFFVNASQTESERNSRSDSFLLFE